MTKKNSLLILIILAILLLIAAVLFVLPLSILKPHTISDCKNLECVKKFALSKDFNPEDCKNAPEQFRNNCYYVFEVENKEATREILGKYCGNIINDDSKSDCFYKSNGAIIFTKSDKTRMALAVLKLDEGECNKISIPELKTACLNYVALTKEAKEKNDPSFCQNSPERYVPSVIQSSCLEALKKE